ncbi:class I SAM-dependent methyltransferase [candidate division KSB1 bacterium]|nr:class I SAM-dependent methyltransferase [candidate division KSB1 bacterium]
MSNWKQRSKVYHLFRKSIFTKNIFEEECYSLTELLKLVPQKSLKKVLDIGTGIGDSLHLFDDFTNRFLLDFSFEMLSKLRLINSDIKLVGNVSTLPLKKNSFDLITCIGVSEYISEKDVLLHQIYKTLKKEGYALVTFSPPKILNKMRNLSGKRIYPISGSTAHDLIAAQRFFIVQVFKTKLQSQYLLQKL